MSGGFVKVYGSIRTSSVWVEPHHVFKVWMTLLVEADQHGRVMGSIPGIANAASVTMEEAIEAFEKFLSPDPYSRTKDHEGRRLIEIDGGWLVLNHKKYREMRTEAQIATAERVAQHRARTKTDVTSVTGNSGNGPSASASAFGSGSEGEVQEGGAPADPVFEFCTRLAVAANQGLDQPMPRILASAGSTRQAAEIIHGSDIPIEFAEQVVLDRAQAMTAEARAGVRSLHYFTKAVVQAWEQKDMAEQVKGSKLRPRGKRDAEPIARVIQLATCPLCGAVGIPHGQWTPHFLKHHPKDDTPSFADNITGAA